MSKSAEWSEWVKEARELYANNPSFIDFENHFFSQGSPYMLSLPTKKERQSFLNSREYKEIRKMADFLEAEQKTEYSGTILLRIPSSLHKALTIESLLEDVSLNQLCETKLAVSLGQILADRVK